MDPQSLTDSVAVLGGDLDGDRAAALTGRWGEPHRGYHDEQHLAEMLTAIDALAAGAGLDERGLALVRLAAWYHDAVYDPAAAAGANEEASARLAEADLAAAALSETDVAVVAELVRATAEHALPGPSGAHAVLHDADLWILSAPPTRYADYTAQVRREYAAVPDPDFARGRAAILAPFLDRDRLYATQQAHREWTARARDNLADELARLTR
ncbi:hypothetical protein GCM10027055_22170 [Janibacter alkaliphilus]|uniref:Putative metal-dependent HD superfamily phosphohydrolase n=1 Tax=Janibacter alkaliphilus TaxID=1069963 RepID=A0A852XIT3_9MICO|nr:metal-dependent phosphohydrolase [Janibacter alkaliphilus]NYG38475.1 putative metal-dependent HD superfamily phosphohydrolase [Janibacter alkaliphilus]